MKAGMLFSPVFVHTESRSARLQTASRARFASPCLLPPSSNSRLESLRFHACNLCRFNTYEPSRKCGKQRTYRKPKSFRCNTYKKHRGEGLLWLTRHPVRGVCPVYLEPRRELGIKVRGFLRHHFARRGDFHHLLDVA